MASTKKLGKNMNSKKKSKTSSNKLYHVRVIEEDGDLVNIIKYTLLAIAVMENQRGVDIVAR